jgi:uncharacterized membrane protein required for colicin V production
MNGRRTARLALVPISNGLLFWLGVRVVLHRSDGLTSMLLGALLCVACVTGVILEVRRQGAARALNIGIPTTVGALMASSFFWLPVLAKLQHSEYPGEAAEGAAFLLLFAGYPLCLAIITLLAYWLIDIEPSRTETGLGLK